MSSGNAYRYAVFHAVPRADRDERVNIGVILFAQRASFLGARFSTDFSLLRTLGADATAIDGVRASIAAISAICAGNASAGEAATRPQTFRFGHLTAPRSTIVRAGDTHGGIGRDPADVLDQLFDRFVAR